MEDPRFSKVADGQKIYFIHSLTSFLAIFGFLDISNKDYLIVNHLLLLFKYYIYNARDRKHLVLEALMKIIKNVYDIEKNLADQDPHKKTKFLKKWQSAECAVR